MNSIFAHGYESKPWYHDEQYQLANYKAGGSLQQHEYPKFPTHAGIDRPGEVSDRATTPFPWDDLQNESTKTCMRDFRMLALGARFWSVPPFDMVAS